TPSIGPTTALTCAALTRSLRITSPPAGRAGAPAAPIAPGTSGPMPGAAEATVQPETGVPVTAIGPPPARHCGVLASCDGIGAGAPPPPNEPPPIAPTTGAVNGVNGMFSTPAADSASAGRALTT